MERGNLNDEEIPHASPFVTQRSGEQGCDLLTNYPANVSGIPRVYAQNNNEPRISQYHHRGVALSVGDGMIDGSSQFNNHSNVMFHHPHEGVHQSLVCGPNPGHAPFNLNSSETHAGIPMFNLNVNPPELLDGEYLASNFGNNANAEVNSNFSGVNVAGESQRGFIAPLNTHHSIMDRRRLQYPDFGINNTISGIQNSNRPMCVFPHNAGVRMHSTDNHNLGNSIRYAQPSLPSGLNQTMQHAFAGFSSAVKGSNQPLYGQLPENIMNPYVNTSLQPSASPLGMATSGIDPSISDLGRQAVARNMNAQASMQYARNAQNAMLCARSSSLKRGASEIQSSVSQGHQRRASMNRPLTPPSVPTLTASASSIPYTTQASFASPNTYLSAPSFPPEASAAIPAPYHAKTIPLSLLAGFQSQTISPPHQPQMTQAVSQPQRTTPSVPEPHWKRRYTKASKPEVETFKPFLGYKCCLCKRDLSFDPEGPIRRQPSPPPVSSVLPCGHSFHYDCLLKMTPEESISEPPCIPCTLGE